MTLLNTIQHAGKKIFFHFHDAPAWKEEEHPRAKSGQFTKGAGVHASEKPASGAGAVVVNPVALALKEHGYQKIKSAKGTNLYEHPASGHQVEVHAASPGQKWLTGWTHSEGGTGSGAGKLSKHLYSIPHGAPSGVPPGILPELAKQMKLVQPPGLAQWQATGSKGKEDPGTIHEPTPTATPHPKQQIHYNMTGMGFTPAFSGTSSTVYHHPTKGDVTIKHLVPSTGIHKGKVNWVYKPPNGLSVSGHGIAGGNLAATVASKQSSWLPSDPEVTKENVVKPSWSKYPNEEPTTYKGKPVVRYYTGNPNSPDESLLIGTGPDNKGEWLLFKKGEGIVAEGTGQEALNDAFEQLHPRGAGGKFIAKPGGDVPSLGQTIAAAGFQSASYATPSPGYTLVYQNPNTGEMLHLNSVTGGYLLKNSLGGAIAKGAGPEEMSKYFKPDTTPTAAAVKAGPYDLKPVSGADFGEPKTMPSGNVRVEINNGNNTLVVRPDATWTLYQGNFAEGIGEEISSGSKQAEMNVALQSHFSGAGSTAAAGKPPKVLPEDHQALTDAGYKFIGMAPWGGPDTKENVHVYGKPDGSVVLVKNEANLANGTIFPVYPGVFTNPEDNASKTALKAMLGGVTPKPGIIPTVGPPSGGSNLPGGSNLQKSLSSILSPLKADGFEIINAVNDDGIVAILKNNPLKMAVNFDHNTKKGVIAWQLPGQPTGTNEVFNGNAAEFHNAVKQKFDELTGLSAPVKAEHFTKTSTVPDELNGVKFNTYQPPDTWSAVEGQNEHVQEPPMVPPPGKKVSAGLLIEEPDGRIWIVKPANAFGGYNYTFPKGGQEPGLSLQATAIKETWEESGLKAEITGFAGDYHGDTSITRYYLAKRTGGTPTEFGTESEGVTLVPREELSNYLNKARDLQIAKDQFSPKAIGHPVQLSDLTKVGEKKGSNPGGIYETAEGKRYYVKHLKTPEHVANELLAADLLSKGGGGTLKYHAVPGDGKNSIGTDWEALQKDNVSKLSLNERKQAQSDFALNAWLANWDAAGTGGDNVGVLNGKTITLDVGGALLYRAQGDPKGSAFGYDPTEWESMRNPAKIHPYKLYGDMTNEQLKESAAKLNNITNKDIVDAVHAHFDKDSDVATELTDKLIARRDKILALGAALPVAPKAPAYTPTPSYTPPKPPPPVYTLANPGPHGHDNPDGVRRKIAEWSPPKKPTTAITAYKGNSYYHKMNALMRHGELEDQDTSPEANYVREITAWLDNASTKEDTVIYRGVTANTAKHWNSFAKPGRTIRDPGFQSTSTSKTFADNWHHGTGLTIKIHMPAGTKAGTIRNTNESDGEYEVLLQKNLKMRIINWDHGNYEVRIEN